MTPKMTNHLTWLLGILITISTLLLIVAELNTDNVISRITIVTAWCLLLAALVFTIYLLKKQQKLQISRFQKEREKGYVLGQRDSIKQIVLKSDVLDQIQSWLYVHGKEKDGSQSVRMFSLLLKELQRLFGLHPVSVGTLVKFDPAQQQAWEQIYPGEDAIVVESGWVLDSETIKKPVIIRRIKK